MNATSTAAATAAATATAAPTPATPLRAPHCPLCGEANGCVPAATGTFDQRCWCVGVAVDREVLARVPDAMKGKACLCPRCAAIGRQAPPSASRAEP